MIKLLTATSEQEQRTIAVDLDGTLAHYEEFDPRYIGDPVPEMLARVKQWLKDGFRIVIFTARVADGKEETLSLIQNWIVEHIGEPLDITCRKTPDLEFLVDDKAIPIVKNTGRIGKIDGASDIV